MSWCSSGSLSLGGTRPCFLLRQLKKLLEASLVVSRGFCFGVRTLPIVSPSLCGLCPQSWQAQAAEESFVQFLS